MFDKPPNELFALLSEREREVLNLVCQHNRYKDIAKKLFISINTVKTHMTRIYNKLEFHDLSQTERVLAVHNVYCPMFSEVDELKEDDVEIEIIDVVPEPEPHSPEEEIIDVTQEPESILSDEEEIVSTNSEPESKSPDVEEITDVTPEPEPLSPDEEETIDSDEMALITYTPEPIIGGKEKMKPKKKRGCLKFVIVLILGVLLTIGAWQAWQYLKDIPIVSSIIELIDPGVTTETISEASSETKSELSSIAEPIISSIKSSLGSSEDVYEIGEWHKEDDMWIRLRDYELTNYDYDKINLFVEIWNKSDNEIHFSWDTETHLELKDNIGTRYKLTNRYIPGSDNETLLPQERSDLIPGLSKATAEYFVSPMFENGVTELLFSVDYLSRFEKVTWRIPINK